MTWRWIAISHKCRIFASTHPTVANSLALLQRKHSILHYVRTRKTKEPQYPSLRKDKKNYLTDVRAIILYQLTIVRHWRPTSFASYTFKPMRKGLNDPYIKSSEREILKWRNLFLFLGIRGQTGVRYTWRWRRIMHKIKWNNYNWMRGRVWGIGTGNYRMSIGVGGE